MTRTESVRVLGFDMSSGACIACDGQLNVTEYEKHAVARARARLGTEDVQVARGCSGRACVRWDNGQPCLTTSFLEGESDPSWGIALKLINYEEGAADAAINLVRASSPSFAAMDVALFDPDHRWVTTQHVRLSRDEWGALSHTIGTDPLLLAATFEANGQAVSGGSEMGDLPRSLGPGHAQMVRQAADDAMWLLSWMTRKHRFGGPLVLYQRGGDTNEQAVSLAVEGRVDDAISLWETIDVEDSRIAFNLGMAYAVLGDDEQSIAHFGVAESQRSRGYSRRLLEAARKRESFRSRARPLLRCRQSSSEQVVLGSPAAVDPR